MKQYAMRFGLVGLVCFRVPVSLYVLSLFMCSLSPLCCMRLRHALTSCGCLGQMKTEVLEEAFDTMVGFLPSVEARLSVLRHACQAWGLDADGTATAKRLHRPLVEAGADSIVVGRVRLTRVVAGTGAASAAPVYVTACLPSNRFRIVPVRTTVFRHIHSFFVPIKHCKVSTTALRLLQCAPEAGVFRHRTPPLVMACNCWSASARASP
jgi:hypothetical protein